MLDAILCALTNKINFLLDCVQLWIYEAKRKIKSFQRVCLEWWLYKFEQITWQIVCEKYWARGSCNLRFKFRPLLKSRTRLKLAMQLLIQFFTRAGQKIYNTNSREVCSESGIKMFLGYQIIDSVLVCCKFIRDTCIRESYWRI